MRTRLTAPLVASAAGLLLALAGCSTSSSDTGQSAASPTTVAAAAGTATSAKHVLVKEFAETVKQPGVVILDVRTPAEYAAGHLAGAKNIDIEGSGFNQQISGLDKSASYAIYCRSGNRSVTAGKVMVAAGFTKVVGLLGGINAWTAAGNPTTTS